MNRVLRESGAVAGSLKRVIWCDGLFELILAGYTPVVVIMQGLALLAAMETRWRAAGGGRRTGMLVCPDSLASEHTNA